MLKLSGWVPDRHNAGYGTHPGELLSISELRAGGFWPEQVGKSYLFGKILPARMDARLLATCAVIRSGWASRAVCWIYDV